ncbi:MptD family putative ECF transporter S component [Sporomusa sp.]|jgi:energy-coupling factor transport system substrate-specific component|uniref:MptD family putative ECF transporter S component n=1 Tax=Sporomusa sp. TaxID=2078658 RepID=UPI002CAC344F|nr:MptD family putative ECF transporter S component [Sporomusa sp.]HWR06647.1 MptD family putative ECF transporter S component [Sporomusa sp.]
MAAQADTAQTVRYLITIGIFNALIIGIFMSLGFTIGLIPVVLIFMPVILAIPGGIIFMLMLAKAPMRGVFVISGAMLGLVMFTMAPAGVFGLSIFAGGVAGELVFGWLGRQRFAAAATGFACYMLGFAIGESLPLTFMKEAYLAQEARHGIEQLTILQQCLDLMNPPLFAAICLLTVLASYVGSFWGRRLLKAHFEKAGIV